MGRGLASLTCVGRAEELEALERAFALARESEPQSLLISGDAGVGKTRLVEEFLRRSAGRGPHVLAGGCVAVTQGELPYAPLVQALRGLIRDSTTRRSRRCSAPRGELARLLPELSAEHPRHSVDPSVANVAQARLFELILGLLARLSPRRPVIIILEDLQWSDPSTRDFIGFLVRNLSTERIMLVGTYRRDELIGSHPMRAFAAGLARASVRSLELGPLERAEVAQQIEAITGSRPSAEKVRRIYERSQGNPFFAEELADAGEGVLPETLRDLLLIRIEGLSQPTRSLLALLAVAGRPLEHRLLVELGGLTEVESEQALKEAVAHHVIVPEPVGLGYLFRHALVREAVYSDLLPAERARLHARFAEIFRNRAASPSGSAELAYHCHESGDAAGALAASYKAGVASMDAYAFAEALTHFDRCLELWDRVAKPERLAGVDRATVNERASECAYLTGAIERSCAYAQAALDLVDDRTDPVRAGLLNQRLGRCLWTAADGTSSLQAYQEAVRLVPADPPTPERARVLAAEGQIVMLMSRYTEASSRLTEAIAIARKLKERSIEAHALCSLGPVTAFVGDVERAEGYLLDARRIAEETGDAESLGRSYVNLSTVLAVAGRPTDGLALAREGEEVARRWGIARSFGTWMIGEAAFRLVELGRYEESETACNEILRRDPVGYEEIANLLLAQIALVRGDIDTAKKHLAQAQASESAWHSLELDVPVLLTASEVALQERDFEAARQAISDGLKIAAEGDDRYFRTALCAFGMRIEAEHVATERGARPGEADLDRAEFVEFLTTEMEDASRLDVPIAQAHVRSWKAERAAYAGEPQAELWGEAAEAWAALEHPLPALYARWRQAEVLLHAKLEAASLLREADAAARLLDARLLQAEIRSLAQRARIDLAPPEESSQPHLVEGWERLGLTARELEVLLLLADGRSNKEIGEELFISAKTASVHVSRILMKLGASSRVEAAGIAFKQGLMKETD